MEEVQFAEREVIKHVQRLSFPDVIRTMQRISSLAPSNFRVKEPKDASLHAQTASIIGRRRNPKSWRATRKFLNHVLG